MVSQQESDMQYMLLALNLAEKGRYSTLPNPCVGCVLTKDGVVIGSGYHKKAGTGHAEVNALADARNRNQDTAGATAYVTLEPCSHFGLTPPCAVALVKAGIKRVVCAMTDPNPLVSGKGFEILRNAGIEVFVGICESQAREINVPFLYAMEHEIPYVTQKMGISLDGKIALANGESKWITSPESRSDVQALRAENQAIMTTADTVKADNPSMNVRYTELPDSVKETVTEELVNTPVKIIIDKHEILTRDEKIFSSSGQVMLVYPSTDGKIEEKVISEKLTILRIPLVSDTEHQNDNIDIECLLKYLHTRKIRNILVESGPKFSRYMMDRNLINKLVLYVAPKLMGDDAISFCKCTGFGSMDEIRAFRLAKCTQIGDDIKLEYIIKE